MADGKYVANSSGDIPEVDLLAEKCVADIKAKLQAYAASKHVPACLEGFLKPEEAAKDYSLAVAFIEKHKHAYISNGGFLIDKYDPATNSVILDATPFADYPLAKGEMAKKVATSYARINSLKVGTYQKGADVAVDVAVAEIAFPANTAKAAAKAIVKVTLVADKDYVYAAKASKAGLYRALIPAKDLAALKAGTYTVIGEAGLGPESGAVDTASLIVF